MKSNNAHLQRSITSAYGYGLAKLHKLPIRRQFSGNGSLYIVYSVASLFFLRNTSDVHLLCLLQLRQVSTKDLGSYVLELFFRVFGKLDWRFFSSESACGSIFCVSYSYWAAKHAAFNLITVQRDLLLSLVSKLTF